MIILRLASGGRVAVRPDEVAVAQATPWGAVFMLASDGSKFEVEHSLDALGELVPTLWFRTPDTFFNPDHITSIWEEDGLLHYVLEGGLKLTQAGADLDQFLDAIKTGQQDRSAREAARRG